jgi:hypothetical protein
VVGEIVHLDHLVPPPERQRADDAKRGQEEGGVFEGVTDRRLSLVADGHLVDPDPRRQVRQLVDPGIPGADDVYIESATRQL